MALGRFPCSFCGQVWRQRGSVQEQVLVPWAHGGLHSKLQFQLLSRHKRGGERMWSSSVHAVSKHADAAGLSLTCNCTMCA